ncbi:hypothetical protein DP939_11895 [Spongiactinospora rosea]|uniref:Uncharacterized protein n=1 Tax=Spongiactinospora rosea TaxID=2248750 RepID=A0A366M3Y4_9ACTN|nr:hypothetical protein [Spongiactinospora rosea]RBQ20470.1 hypothetical protein DP939_11895 [Spongiactinospora rosea]
MMLAVPGRSPFDWLTVPDILADLGIPLADWQEWETAGNVPAGVVWPDGQVRISVLSYGRWLDSLAVSDDTTPPSPNEVRGTILDALEIAAARGLSHAELCRMFAHHGVTVPPDVITATLDDLIRNGVCHSHTIDHSGPPVIRYRFGRRP